MQQTSGAAESVAPTTVQQALSVTPTTVHQTLSVAPVASIQPEVTLHSQPTASITVTPSTTNTVQAVHSRTHPLSIFNIAPGLTIAPNLPLAVAPGTLPSYQQAQMLAAQTPVTMATSVALAQAQPQPLLDGQSGLAITLQIGDKEAVLDKEKKAICRHPLFPLLSLLFNKCEQATQTADCPSADSFGVDIQQFVQQQEREHKPFFNDEPDLDSLMVKAIQVLRIHLLELEKVNDLCKDFCSRYITCLKGKLQSENLLRIEGSEFDLSPPSTPTPQTPIPVQQVVTSIGGNSVILQQGIQQPAVSMATLGQGQLVSGGTVYQMVQTPQGIVAQPVQIQTAPLQTAIPQSPIIHGSTPLSQIGMVTPTTPTATPTVNSSFLIPTTPTSPCDEDDRLGDKKSKRGVLPKSATHVMRSWLFQHIVHPYPTEDEKRIIANQTNLTLLQVNNWFINARRRILQPMLDSSNPDQNKTKKARPPSRPVQRFWPDKIANLQPQLNTAIDQVPISTDPGSVEGAVTSVSMSIGQPDLAISTNTHIPQPHQIILQPGSVITADGQIVNAGSSAVSLTALQGAQLPTIQWQVPVGRPNKENGMDGAQNVDLSQVKDDEEL